MKNAPLQLLPDAMVGLPHRQPVGRTPHVTLHAFCESPDVAGSMRRAADDRRLSRATTQISLGGIDAAIAYCSGHRTPDVMILESTLPRPELLAALAELAPVCDANTQVIVVGISNDIALYRELLSGGVTDYLLAPVDALTIISAILRLFPEDNATRMGKVCAVIGAKGGVGSSLLAQNLAWTVTEGGLATLLADMDLQFGTAALNFDIDCHTGFADQLPHMERLDAALLERLIFKHGPHLSVLPCATAAHVATDPDMGVIEKVLDLARGSFPHVLLDLPNAWSPLVRASLVTADDIVLVAEPDLANLRNARCLLDFLQQVRPNDPPPQLVMNRVGMPKRREIKPEKFAAALEIGLAAQIPFDPGLFGTAAANGQMIAQISRNAAVSPVLNSLAARLTGRPPRRERKGLGRFWPRSGGTRTS